MHSSTPRPHFTPGKDPVPILQKAGWAPGPVWTGGKYLPHRDSIPDRPARSSVAIPTELPGPNMCVLLVLNYLHSPNKTGAVWLSLVHFVTRNKRLEKTSFSVSYLHTLQLLLLLLLLLLLSHSSPIFTRRHKITSQFRGQSAPSRHRASVTVETLNSRNPHLFVSVRTDATVGESPLFLQSPSSSTFGPLCQVRVHSATNRDYPRSK